MYYDDVVGTKIFNMNETSVHFPSFSQWFPISSIYTYTLFITSYNNVQYVVSQQKQSRTGLRQQFSHAEDWWTSCSSSERFRQVAAAVPWSGAQAAACCTTSNILECPLLRSCLHFRIWKRVIWISFHGMREDRIRWMSHCQFNYLTRPM